MGAIKEEEQGRIASVDALRGIGAFLVVLSHALPAAWLLQSSRDPTLFLSVGRIGVAAFFMVSGYVIPFSFRGRDTVGSFWIKRFFRLWPAYWLTIILAMVVVTPRVVAMGNWQLALNFTMLQQFFLQPNAVSVFWTLQIELVFYVLVTLFAVSGLLFDIRWNTITIVGLVLASIASGFARSVYQAPLPVALPIALSMMFVGTRVRFVRMGLCRNYAALFALTLVGILVACHFAYNSGVRPTDNGGRFMVAYSIAMLLFLTFEQMRGVPRVMEYLGVISYSVYLLHPVVLHAIEKTAGDISVAWRLAIDIPATLVVAAIVYYAIEHPAQNIGRRIASKLRANHVAPHSSLDRARNAMN